MTINEDELTFRTAKAKELSLFFNYLSETGAEEFAAMGVSLKSLKKMFLVNRLLLGIPSRFFIKNMKIYVLEKDKEIIAGYSLSYNKIKDDYLLGNVFTRPDLQGQGIGNILLKRIISENTGTDIRLEVNANNAVAIHLYEKYGFEKIHKVQMYISDTPLSTKPLPKNYTIKEAQKSDVEKLGKLTQTFPELGDLKSILKKSLNKSKKSFMRIQFKIAAVVTKDDELVGFGRAIWTKATLKNADIITRALLLENKSIYPCLVSYLTERIKEFGVEKFAWERNEHTENFFTEIKPYLGEPFQEGFLMIKTG